MIAVTLKTAKARLNELVNRALPGGDVILMKGSRHVASIVPISESDLELSPRLNDAQALRLLDRIRTDRREGRTRRFPTPEEAVKVLRREFEPPSRRPSRRRR